jgi:drug/metabolite transporter (DMT)-like permease
MQGAFVQALTYRPPVALGRQLRPFSAWHGLILDAAGNAFMLGGIPGLEDTVFAALVCSLSFADGIEAYTDKRRVSKWGRKYGPDAITRASLVLRGHILAGLHCPEYGQDGKGKPVRAPYWWHLATFARVQLGMSEAAAWDAPVSRLACYRACVAEGEGWDKLKSDEEIDGAEILKAGA